MDSLIYGLIFIPMAGAAVSYIVGRKDKKYRDYLGGALSVLEFVLAVFLLYRYITGGSAGGVACLPGVCGMPVSRRLCGCVLRCFPWSILCITGTGTAIICSS